MADGSRFLLDTHVVLWWLAGDAELSDDIKSTIEDEIVVYVSAATVWEVGIKQGIGKLRAEVDLAEAIAQSDLRPLPISLAHARAAGQLPLHHRDPFDRMLVAQARSEDLTLVTRNQSIHAYDVRTRSA